MVTCVVTFDWDVYVAGGEILESMEDALIIDFQNTELRLLQDRWINTGRRGREERGGCGG